MLISEVRLSETVCAAIKASNPACSIPSLVSEINRDRSKLAEDKAKAKDSRVLALAGKSQVRERINISRTFAGARTPALKLLAWNDGITKLFATYGPFPLTGVPECFGPLLAAHDLRAAKAAKAKAAKAAKAAAAAAAKAAKAKA